jgi:hypothetical protein
MLTGVCWLPEKASEVLKLSHTSVPAVLDFSSVVGNFDTLQ